MNDDAKRGISKGRYDSFEDAPASGLTGIIQPGKRTAASDRPRVITDAPPVVDDGKDSPVVTKEEVEVPSPRDEAPDERSSNGMRGTTGYFPQSVKKLMTNYRYRTGSSAATTVIEALTELQPRLRNLVNASPEQHVSGGGLFMARATRSRSTDDPLVGVHMRFYDADYKVIDQLVEQSGAASRSHLYTVAVREYLTNVIPNRQT